MAVLHKDLKRVVIFRGMPGSGKTSLANYLDQCLGPLGHGSRVVCTDDYLPGNGTVPLGEHAELLLDRAYTARDARFTALLESGVSPIFFTSVSPTGAVKQKELAESYGYIVHVVIVENTHGGETIHPVPEETIRNMREKFEVRL